VIQALVQQKLEQHGFRLQWSDAVLTMLSNLRTAPLERDLDLTFSRIDTKNRLNELEFYFPVKLVSPDRLGRILEAGMASLPLDGFPRRVERLLLDPVRGFMRGFIDMVFHWRNRFFLVDWKSNHMGNRVKDYGQEALQETMTEEYYVLQYLIYTLALDRYLNHRVPGYRYETHFGGVYYVFLRGIDPIEAPDCGIFKDRPSARLIHALGKELLGTP
jgi:exodeoxyribonuclease V beta subunit